MKKGALLLILTISLYLPLGQAGAANLPNRSIVLGNVRASATTNHQFQFDITNSNVIGSIAFEYCDAPLVTDPCVAPSGIDVSSVSLSNQSGETGFSVHANTVSNRIVITRTPAATSPGTVSYNFTNAVNPDTPNQTTYVRITTYGSDDGSGSFEDNGAVAFSLTPALGVSVFVPPYLTFCVGVTVALDCQSSSGLKVDLGVLEANQTSSATTQFAGATNDESGYNVSVNGITMTSGNNEISRLANPSSSVKGVEQFGINLRDNSNPNTGKNPEGSGSLNPTANYATANKFTFNPGETISSSSSATEYNRMTVSYIVNITSDQPPGIYSTTLTYIAVASF